MVIFHSYVSLPEGIIFRVHMTNIILRKCHPSPEAMAEKPAGWLSIVWCCKSAIFHEKNPQFLSEVLCHQLTKRDGLKIKSAWALQNRLLYLSLLATELATLPPQSKMALVLNLETTLLLVKSVSWPLVNAEHGIYIPRLPLPSTDLHPPRRQGEEISWGYSEMGSPMGHISIWYVGVSIHSQVVAILMNQWL